MPVCTYLRKKEYKTPTSNKMLNELLTELCHKTSRDWRLKERVLSSGFLWWKREARRYFLYLYIGEHPFSSGGEFQIINLGHDDAETVEAYMLGYLGGVEQKP